MRRTIFKARSAAPIAASNSPVRVSQVRPAEAPCVRINPPRMISPSPATFFVKSVIARHEFPCSRSDWLPDGRSRGAGTPSGVPRDLPRKTTDPRPTLPADAQMPAKAGKGQGSSGDATILISRRARQRSWLRPPPFGKTKPSRDAQDEGDQARAEPSRRHQLRREVV